MNSQLRAPHDLGFVPQPSSFGTTSLQLSGTGGTQVILALSFVPADSRKLASVALYNSANMVGTPSGANSVIDLFSDSGGSPGSSLTSSNTQGLGSAPSASSWMRWTGLDSAWNLTLTAGTQYWILIKSLDSSNYIAPSYGNSNTGIVQSQGSGSSWGWYKKHSSNGAGSWGTGVACSAGWRVGSSDGSYNGMPVSAIAADPNTVYGSNETGVQFTTPANSGYNVRGLLFSPQSSGAQASRGPLAYRLYDGSGNLLGTTASVPAANFGTGYYPLYFSSAVVLLPGSTYRATMTQAGSGDATHYYQHGNAYTWDTDSNSLPLQPMDGTYNYVTYNGTSFTTANTPVLPFSLLLDTTGEFTPTGGPMFGRVVYPANIPLF
jgi:hypothetical protein